MKTKITLVFAILFCLCSFGQVGTVFTSGGIKYKITAASTVEVGQNSGITGAITIPSSVTYSSATYQVKSIGLGAFQSNLSLSSITIPSSVTSIGQEAFLFCSGLSSVSIPNSVITIGGFAFQDCTRLTSLTIPNSVTSIGNSTFYNCTGLTSVTIGSAVSSIGERAFEGCLRLTSVTVPNSVTSIGNGAFILCNGLTSISLGSALTSIGNFAFSETGLTSLTIPNSVTTIGNSSFSRCSNLTSIVLGNSVATIGNNAFWFCTSLTSVTIPNSVTVIGTNSFQSCSNLTSVTLGNSITSIGNFSFSNCNRLTTFSVNWTTPLTVDANIFSGLTLSNKTLNVPAGRAAAYDASQIWTDFGTIIEQGAATVPFMGQTFAANGINYIVSKSTLPYEVAVGSNTTFVGAANIPAGVTNAGNSFVVTNIGDYAFRNCVALTSISIPNSVTNIGNGAFDSCTGLSSLSIPNSVTSIGENAFNSCINLTSVVIPNSITIISEGLFSSCSALTSVTIPNSVSTIGRQAFSGCIKLTSVIIPDAVTNISDRAFESCTSLTSVTIGNAVTFIGVEAFSNCVGLTSINIPASVEIIDVFAFDNCPGLTSVTVNWIVPIEIGAEIFGFNLDDNGDLDLSHITLFVPAGTQAAYDAAEVWTSFRSVIDVDNVFNYCKGAVALPLTAPFAAGSTIKWYTVATGGRTLTTAPTPTTTTVGTKLFYVSQVVGGVESARQTITVNTFALPATPGTITGTAAQGSLVGTATLATYSITPVAGATSYDWTAPLGVNIISGQGTNTVTVNFADVSTGAGAIGNLSVVAVNSSDCSSLVRNLALTTALPAAPVSIKMYDDAFPTFSTTGAQVAIRSFAKYMGTDRVLRLTATPSVTATSYIWELPEGVNQLSGGTSNEITVNFLGVTNVNTFNYTTTTGISTNVLRIGVKASNGVGVSTTNTAALLNPSTSSTARLLTLTAVRPAAVAAVTGQIAGLCGASTYTYTIRDTALASSYTVTAPAGAVVNFTSTLTFTVTYPIGFVVNTSTTLANKTLVITSVNGVGMSATARTLTLSTTMPALGVATPTSYTRAIPVSITIAPLAGAVSYNWTGLPAGAVIVSGQGTNVVRIDFAAVAIGTTFIKITVTATNACGISTAVKAVNLSNIAPGTKVRQIVAVTATEVYPNPTADSFSIDVLASRTGTLEMTIYSLNGAIVANPKTLKLQEGNNTISEDISSLARGVYLVHLANSSSNEVIIKKLVKE